MTADFELVPEQAPEIVAAVEKLLDRPAERPDPWWRAGVDESLYGETAARPRSTLGAERA